MGYFSLFGAIAAFLIGFILKKLNHMPRRHLRFQSEARINYKHIFVMSMQQRQWVTFPRYIGLGPAIKKFLLLQSKASRFQALGVALPRLS